MKKKVLSALIMLLLGIPILIAGGKVFALTIGLIAVLSLKEILDLKKSHEEYPEIIKLLSMAFVLLFTFVGLEGSSFEISYKGLVLAFFCFLIPTLFYKEKYNTTDACYLLFWVIFLGFSFHGALLFRELNLYYFLYILCIPILTDTFAMYCGMLFGKHKCAKVVSPNKTWEGSIGGSLLGTICASLIYTYFIGNIPIVKLCFFTLLLTIFAQLGDLFFSKIKRENKIKDFSDLIPGHGGMLDRIDSLLFTILLFIFLFPYY